MVDGDDRGALVALLRSPLVALSDESLLRLRLLRRLRLDLLDRVETLATLPADEAERLLRFCGVLRDVQPRVVLTTAEACIRDVVDGLDLPAVLAATRQGPSRVANLERLVDHAARFAERGTLAAFAGWLRGRMARGDEAEEAQAFDEGDDVVRVMTAHQAKGLQFPVVFIPDCGGSGRADAGHVRYAPSLGLGVRARPDNPLDRWDPTFPFTRVAEHNGERRRAESLRLLYVAATRAEDLVIFSGEGRGWRAELDGWRAATSQADLLIIVDDHQLPVVRVARAEQLALIPPSTEAAAWVSRAYGTPPLVPRVLTVAVTALHAPSGAPEQFFTQHNGEGDERLDPLARGSLAHRLLERCRFGDAGTVDAELHAAGYAVDDPAATEIRADVQRFLLSPFGRSLAGRRLRRELPFLLALPLGATELQLRGQIDLAIFDDDGITLVDYKNARSATSKGDGATSSTKTPAGGVRAGRASSVPARTDHPRRARLSQRRRPRAALSRPARTRRHRRPPGRRRASAPRCTLEAAMSVRLTSLLLLGVLFFSSPARADSQLLAPVKLDLNQLDHDIKRARIRRNIGIGLAVPGLASTILGAILLTYGISELHRQNLGDVANELGAGGSLGILGLATAIPGVALWIMGQDNIDTLKWRREQVVTPFVSTLPRSDGAGGVVGVRVTF